MRRRRHPRHCAVLALDSSPPQSQACGLVQQLSLGLRVELIDTGADRLLDARIETSGMGEVGLEHDVVRTESLHRLADVALEPVETVDLTLKVLGRAQR